VTKQGNRHLRSMLTVDVLAICRELNLQNVIFVGHSVSAMIGALAAIQEPERFDRLVLIGPSPRYINDGEYGGCPAPAAWRTVSGSGTSG
jgi:pimeloyl-ACP methyl ester carboxylesterase